MIKEHKKWTGPALAICKAVARVTGVNELNIQHPNGVIEVREARKIAFASLRLLGFSFARIGRMCGGYKHTTILLALSRIKSEQAALARSIAATVGIRGDDEAMDREAAFRRNVENWRVLCSGKYAQNKELVRGYFSGKSYAAKSLEGGIQ